MAKTRNIGLNITPSSENKKKFKDFRAEIAGDGPESNMVIIDEEIGTIKKNIVKRVIYSSTQPDGQEEGDIWNEILG